MLKTASNRNALMRIQQTQIEVLKLTFRHRTKRGAQAPEINLALARFDQIKQSAPQ